MAMINPRVFEYHPRLPDRESLSPENLRIVYDDALDALYLDFGDEHQPAVSIDIDESDIYARVDPVTDLIVGLQVEMFLARSVIDHPSLLILAEAAGIPEARLTEVRQRIDPTRLKAAALHETLHWLSRADAH